MPWNEHLLIHKTYCTVCVFFIWLWSSTIADRIHHSHLLWGPRHNHSHGSSSSQGFSTRTRAHVFRPWDMDHQVHEVTARQLGHPTSSSRTSNYQFFNFWCSSVFHQPDFTDSISSVKQTTRHIIWTSQHTKRKITPKSEQGFIIFEV